MSTVTQPGELAKRIAEDVNAHLDGDMKDDFVEIDALIIASHIAPLEAWKAAIEEAAVVNWTLTAENANDPRKAVRDLIACIMREALDPMVSQPASDLHEKIKGLESDNAALRQQVVELRKALWKSASLIEALSNLTTTEVK